MEKLKTEWLYYHSKYENVLDESKYADRKYLLSMPDRIAFVEYLKECSLKELIMIITSIFKDRYPLEYTIVFASLEKEKYRTLDDLESFVYKIDDLFYIISYTITFKEEQPEILAVIQSVLADKEVIIDTQDDQTIFTVVNSPIKELVVSNKRMTLHVNEDAIDIALGQQDS